jgi:hypothetical protein
MHRSHEPKRRSILLAMGLLAFGALALPAWSAEDVTGTWKGQITDPVSGKHDIVLRLKNAGGQIGGTLTGGPPRGDEQPISNFRLDGNQFSFEIEAQGPGGEKVVLIYKGTLTGNHISGTHEGPHRGPDQSVPWEATKH